VKFPIWFSVAFLAAFLVPVASIEAQPPPPNTKELSETEKWVVIQATKGEEADLSQNFPAVEQRHISARFLEDALTGSLPGFRLHRRGIRIVGAIIDDSIDLSNAQVACPLALARCEFRREVILRRANFSAAIAFDGSTFKDNLNCNSMKNGQDVFLRNAIFEKGVSFVLANITGGLVLRGAQFLDAQEVANFNSLKTEQSIFIDDTTFEGSVNFVGVEIGGSFEANNAKFNNSQAIVVFNSIKVGKNTLFANAVFHGGLSLTYSQFLTLEIGDVTWPAEPRLFHLEGVTYKNIRAAVNETKSREELLRIADKATYSADVYRNLEEFFSRQGYRDDADQAFVAGKRRERYEYPYGFRRLGSWLLQWLVGYGRHPWQAGIPCLVFVSLGCFLFWPSKMELQKKEDVKRIYNPFWYSLSLFVPFVDLQSHTVWKPKDDHWFLRHYMRVHTLLGWILIPILLAAISGLIK
jgi:hypothetical protein